MWRNASVGDDALADFEACPALLRQRSSMRRVRMSGGFPMSAASKGASRERRPRFAAIARERCGLRLRFVEAAALPRRTPVVASVKAAFDAIGVCVCHFFIVAANIRNGNRRRRKRCVLVRLLESMHIEGVPHCGASLLRGEGVSDT
jgi:hypothetical protein